MKMKRSISNIAWAAQDDESVYRMLADCGFDAIEIAPTRWFPDKPYDHASEASYIAKQLFAEYGLKISSMQSIWYGKTQSLFGSSQDRMDLLEYTRRAIDFAAAIGCGNLVFGCPKNRVIPDGVTDETAIEFFYECGEYATQRGTCFSIEPNPPIYHTNYINTTQEAIDVVRRVDSAGCRINVDLGTMIHNNEQISLIEQNLSWVRHVHLSEPHLVQPCHDDLHAQMIHMLRNNDYKGYVSIEMGSQCGLGAVRTAITKVAKL